MVYSGPSRGCMTCRRRRIRCDETKPYCSTCVKSRRTCGGYHNESRGQLRWKDQTQTVIRAANVLDMRVIASPQALHRYRVPDVATLHSIAQGPPLLHHSIFETHTCQALNIFLSSTIIRAPQDSQSLGYFTSLNDRIKSCATNDPLLLALEAVALASFANRPGNAALHKEASRRYTSCVSRLRDILTNVKDNALTIIACIILMSMYEMIVAQACRESYWLQHVDGLLAVVRTLTENNQLPLFGIPSLILGLEPKVNLKELHLRVHSQKPSLVGPMLPQFDDLCIIMPKVGRLFSQLAATVKQQSSQDRAILEYYRGEAIALKAELLSWATSQPEATRPRTIARFTQPYTLRFKEADDFVCSTTRADAYQNYHVACMWSSYRNCQLHITNFLNRVNCSLWGNIVTFRESEDYLHACAEIEEIADDHYASLAYMLVGDRLRENSPQGSLWVQTQSPLLIGGLSLQWPLFTISILDTVPASVKRDMKLALLWIGKNLGIGQATVLANMEHNIPGGITAKGDTLIWAGYFI